MKILVIGDAILDHYLYGHVNRMSPEDVSVPILDILKEEYRLGGCLNTAANIKSLSSENEVFVSSIIHPMCSEMLKKRGINYSLCVYSEDGMKKIRVINTQSGKQIIRIDNKKIFDFGMLETYNQRIEKINFDDFDYIVVSDYVKGVVGVSLILKLEEFKGVIFVDTKDPFFPMKWSSNLCEQDRLVFKVNYGEWSAAKWVKDQRYTVVVTDGERGAYLWNGRDFISTWPTTTVKNAEVTGAGDVFLAGLVVGYIKGEQKLHNGIKFAIKVATESVRYKGTTEVSLP